MGRWCALSETKKFQIKLLSNKGFSFSVIARNIKRYRKVISNFLQDPEVYGTKKSTGCPPKLSPTAHQRVRQEASRNRNKLQKPLNILRFKHYTQESLTDFKLLKMYHMAMQNVHGMFIMFTTYIHRT